MWLLFAFLLVLLGVAFALRRRASGYDVWSRMRATYENGHMLLHDDRGGLWLLDTASTHNLIDYAQLRGVAHELGNILDDVNNDRVDLQSVRVLREWSFPTAAGSLVQVDLGRQLATLNMAPLERSIDGLVGVLGMPFLEEYGVALDLARGECYLRLKVGARSQSPFLCHMRYRVPLQVSRHLVLVRARVNGEARESSFSLDTGSNLTVMSSRGAKERGLEFRPHSAAMVQLVNRRAMVDSRETTIQLGALVVPLRVGVAESDFARVLERVDGNLGLNAFEGLSIVIDLHRGHLLLCRPVNYRV